MAVFREMNPYLALPVTEVSPQAKRLTGTTTPLGITVTLPRTYTPPVVTSHESVCAVFQDLASYITARHEQAHAKLTPRDLQPTCLKTRKLQQSPTQLIVDRPNPTNENHWPD